MTSAAAIKRLRSRNARHFDGDTGPMLTIVHTTTSGGQVSTTGRLIAETAHEVALNVRGEPVVISTRRIVTRNEHRPRGGNGLPVFDALVRQIFGAPLSQARRMV